MAKQGEPRVQPDKVGYRRLLGNKPLGILIGSRAVTRMGGSTLSYGTMVYLARQDASQLQISAVGATGYLAALLFGLQGGMLADRLSKRIGMLVAFSIEAALCLLIPLFLGTTVGSLMLLMFLASALSQVITPSLKSAVALVASPAELAEASAAIGMIGGVASAIGSSFLAPVLIKVSGLNAILVCAGVLYALGAVRAWKLPSLEQSLPVREVFSGMDWRPAALSIRKALLWFGHEPALGSMVLVGAIVVALFEAFTTLIPLYVREVLGADPANTVYIFAPAGLGYMVAAIFGPVLMRRFGTRRIANTSLVVMAIGMMAFGAIHRIAPLVAWVNPLRVLTLFGFSVGTAVLAAGMIAIPTNFGSTASGQSVQTYINRFVPVERQGATFGLQEVVENAISLIAILTLGWLASRVGTQKVMLLAPPVVIGFVLVIVAASSNMVGKRLTPRESLQTLLGSNDAV